MARAKLFPGIVVMRSGENALAVIDRVKQKIGRLTPALPEGVKIVPVYDRSEFIHRAISNANSTIIQVIVTVVLIILIFLWHFPSAAIPIVTMPVVVLASFIPFHYLGISANIMSLAGVAIAFSELVDASIVVVEQTHKKLELWEKGGRRGDYRAVVLAAVKEVAGPTFFALLVIAISFLPVLTLEAQEGRHVQAAGLHQDSRDADCGRLWRSRSIRRCACCSLASIVLIFVRRGSAGLRMRCSSEKSGRKRTT